MSMLKEKELQGKRSYFVSKYQQMERKRERLQREGEGRNEKIDIYRLLRYIREGERREEERRKEKIDIDRLLRYVREGERREEEIDRVLRDIREGERREEERRKEKIDIDQGKYNFLDIDSDSSDSDETTTATSSSPKPRPILKVFLEGLYDKESYLYKLKVRGCEHVIRTIWSEIRDYYQSAVTKPQPRCRNSYFIDLQKISFPPLFPPPSGININMMPFISSEHFENCRLPAYLNPYQGLIMYCLGHEKKRNPSSAGKVFYLSIEESEVEVGFPQRQPGLHVDRPRWVDIASSKVSFMVKESVPTQCLF